MANVEINKLEMQKSGTSDIYIFDISGDIIDVQRSGNTYTATRKDGTTFTFDQTDTKNTAGSGAQINTKLYLVGATSQNSSGIETYSSARCYIGADNMLYSNNKVVLTEHQDITGKVDKVTGKSLSTNDFTDSYKQQLDDLASEAPLLMQPSAAFSIPIAGASVTKQMPGLTSDYILIKWNFSSSSENNPPVSINWSTSNDSFTITTVSGTTSETIQPIFAKPLQVAIT